MIRLHHLAIASALSIAAAGCASSPDRGYAYGPEDEGRSFADGTRVICENVAVSRDQADPNRIVGTAAGAVIGGVVGSQVGSGSGRTAATVGGAVAGGAIGRSVQGNRQDADRGQVIERQCWRGRPGSR